ncbi:hypothetical protein BCT04_05005 [Vibrio breoganii]|uniref:O-antigen ligase family protein n=1 Tax=Vibrio breoganii TaxID=553239 RepID=UPI000C86119C|nr:O-antigen ligase family protein [Vibrio breoganii]PMM18498.1 hypothetical protein BCT59_11530 [Vibrio breoganii]PMO69207.1 hypothetical protein BCT04_05005 [Vibrio breoganii]
MLKEKNLIQNHKISSEKVPIILLMLLITLSPLLTFKTAFISSFLVAAGELIIVVYYARNLIEFRRLKFENIEIIFLMLLLISVIISNVLAYTKGELLTVEILLSIIRALFLFTHIVFSVTLVKFIFHSKDVNGIMKTIPIVIFIYSVGLILYYTMGFREYLNNDYNGLPLVQNRRFLGYIVMISSIILSCNLLVCAAKVWKSILMMLILTCVNMSFLFWLGGRGAIVAYFLSVVGFLIIQKFSTTQKITHIGSGSFFLSLLVSIIVSSLLSIYDWNGLIRFSFEIGEETLNQYSGSRIVMWLEALEYIDEKPWFGYGSDAYLILGISPHYHPHNFIIQIILEYGVVGFFFFMMFYIILLLKSVKHTIARKVTVQYNVSICVVTALFLHGLLDGTIYHAVPVFFLSIFSSYIYFEINSSRLSK